MSMEIPCVGLAVRTMQLMNFGFAATSARSGSMENV